MHNVNEEMEILKKSRRNVKTQKHYNRNEKCFGWVHQQMDTDKGKINELRDMSVKTLKTEKEMGGGGGEGKNKQKRNNIQKQKITKGIINVQWDCQKKERRKTQEGTSLVVQ